MTPGQMDIPLFTRSFFWRDRRLPLHTMISSCGHCRETDPRYSWNGLQRGTREFAVFQYTLSGEGALEYDGRLRSLRRRDAMLVCVPHDHRYFLPPSSSAWEFAYIVLYGTDAIRIVKSIMKTAGPVLALQDGSAIIDILSTILTRASRNDALSPFTLSHLACWLLMEIAKEVFSGPPSAVASPDVERVKKYLQENLHRAVTVEDMATRVGLSRYHFSRIFTRSEGIPPREYLEQLRVRTAMSLLLARKQSVKEISAQTGYQEVNYFCRVFRRVTGVSPGQFRRIGI